MAFTPKTWENAPNTATPLNAQAMVDLETRLSAYTDAETTRAEGVEANLVSKSSSGVATLTNGAVTISAPTITSNPLILLTTAIPLGTTGALSATGITAGTGFTITSTSSLDASEVYWEIIRY